jgi:hypothetical protein
MRIANFAAAASALVLMASPALAASANPAASLSVASSKQVRAGTDLKKSSEIAPAVAVIGVLAALVGLGFATGVFGGDDSDSN